MKQLLQSFKTGETILLDVPRPIVAPGHLLIKTVASVVSAGTERMLVGFGKASYFEKARQQPDKVKMVLDKIKTDGLVTTYDAVSSKLDTPIPLGYCNAGEVVEVGEGVTAFKIGDKVISNGNHAELVTVPQNLCAKIPFGISCEEAAFTVVNSIALQGVRLLKPTLGERFVIIGLGLIGLVTVQLLKANGCKVLGIDLDSSKMELARQFGAVTVDLSKGEDPLAAAEVFTNGEGVDGVIITAATKSDKPMSQAANMCRKRGRIILVGVTGLQLNRDEFYKKELTFQVSCSYGPGRYDPSYEEQGNDYPLPFVRWTEQRNFEAVLDLMQSQAIEVKSLISHRFTFTDAAKAYDLLDSGKPVLGIIFNYADEVSDLTSKTIKLNDQCPKSGSVGNASAISNTKVSTACDNVVVGFIGSGNFVSRTLVPAFNAAGARLKSIASAGGVSAVLTGKKNKVENATTDVAALLLDNEINTVVIGTRHDSHADLVCKALRAGKHIYCEKPLALTPPQLEEITDTISELGENCPLLMLGFNRRFAPQIVKMKELAQASAHPKTMIMTVNAGAIPSEHWTQDKKVGGGRIIGEGCHFIDLLRFVCGHKITSIKSDVMGGVNGDDKSTITIKFEDGSLGTVHYFANGSKAFPKERLEIFCNGAVLQLDNFRGLKSFGWPGFKKMNAWKQDKGQFQSVQAFVDVIRAGGKCPIPLSEIIEVTNATFEAVQH